jgi:hypothetical protein
MGWITGVKFLARARDFSLLHSIQTGSRADPAFYATDTGTLSLVVVWQRCEAAHSSASITKAKNGGAILSLSHTPLWHSA